MHITSLNYIELYCLHSITLNKIKGVSSLFVLNSLTCTQIQLLIFWKTQIDYLSARMFPSLFLKQNFSEEE